MRSLLLLLLTVAPLPAQDPDPVGQPAFVRIRFIGVDDGLPRPGVLLYQRGDTSPAALASKSGFVVAEQQQVAWLRHAVRSWRSNPAGEVVLPSALWQQRWSLFAGEPFKLGKPHEEADGVVPVEVYETEPVGVRALDSTGRPLANFPVALHAGGKDVSIALTDGEGRALLGMPKDLTARVWLSPAGWVGSRAGMPTIATALAGRRGTDLVVPPHGSVLVFSKRGGLPVKTRLGSIAVRVADEYEWSLDVSAGGEVDGFGFELPFVAVGTRLDGHVGLPDNQRFEGKGPEHGAQVASIGVVLPWRPQVSFRLEGPELPKFTRAVRVCFVTDDGHHETSASRDANGEWQLSGEPMLRGSELQRIDFDVFTDATAKDPPRSWTASVRLCADLATPAFDLGTVAMVAGGTLHGHVVDAGGRPLADVEVLAKPKGGSRGGHLLRTDASGHFAWKMQLPRSDHGTLIPLCAMARAGGQRSATVEAAADGSAIVLRLVEPVADEPKPKPRAHGAGTLVATVDVLPADEQQRWFVRSDLGFGAAAKPVRRQDGTHELRFEKLQAGRYTLSVTDRGGTTHIVLMDLEVPGDGECSDPRLACVTLPQPRVLKVRAVDAQGIPIAGVRVTTSGMILVTDGKGSIRISTHTSGRLPGTFEGTGLRAREVAELTDGMDVVLQAAKTFRVRIAGLPDDVPRERIEVWVRHEERERFLGPRGTPDGDGVTELSTPQAGRYYVNLLVRSADPKRKGSTTLVATRPGWVVIGDAGAPDVAWELAADIVQLLRERAR
ncbi:MAG TPA: hypothetical protein VF384_10150 [Planctomycetota bacterium]